METDPLTHDDIPLILADREAMRNPRPLADDSWAKAIIPDPFLVLGVDSPIPF